MSVIRNKVAGSYGIVKEHWTADTKEEMMDLFEQQQAMYPTQGYGTSIYDIRLDPTGLVWHAQYSRFTSCD